MYIVRIRKEAQVDIADACNWYEHKQKGLSLKFLKEIRRYQQILINDPYLFNVRFSETMRFANLSTFPYFLVYQIDEDAKIIYLNAVYHTSRNPKDL